MINVVTLHGRLVRDPELRTTNSGKSVCGFTIANETGFGDRKNTHYIDCVAWERTAEFLCNYFAKGQEILVSGSLQTREYTDKQGGKRKAVEVVVREADFCGPKGQGSTGSTSPKPQEESMQFYDSDEDLPF